MQSITSLSQIMTIAVLTAVIFSVLHAKDVSAASVILNPSFATNTQQARGIENTIHIELHTHVDRQPLSSLLQNMQNDKPLTHTRTLKKNYMFEKKQSKLHDGMLGYHLPELA